MKSVLVPIADGSEDMETATIVDVLRRAGADVVVASVQPDGSLAVTAARGLKLVADTNIAQCLDHNFDLIALPGGAEGAENLRDCRPLINKLANQKVAGRWYAAICASPQTVLAHHHLIDDRKATGHPGGFQNRLPNRASGRVVIDSNCITSQGPGTALEFSLTLVEVLFGKAARKEVAAPMVL